MMPRSKVVASLDFFLRDPGEWCRRKSDRVHAPTAVVTRTHDYVVEVYAKKKKKNSCGLVLNVNAYYKCQGQQQLFSSGYEYEDLVLSDLKEIIILSIKGYDSFLKKQFPRLQAFYDQTCLSASSSWSCPTWQSY